MKVIKQGPDTTKPFTYTATCADCKTELLVEEKDMRFAADERDGNAMVYKCMVCERENWVSSREFPRHVIRRLARW